MINYFIQKQLNFWFAKIEKRSFEIFNKVRKHISYKNLAPKV